MLLIDIFDREVLFEFLKNVREFSMLDKKKLSYHSPNGLSLPGKGKRTGRSTLASIHTSHSIGSRGADLHEAQSLVLGRD